MKLMSTILTRCMGLRKIISRYFQRWLLPAYAVLVLPLTACMVGPKYQRPSAPIPGAYKELPPPDAAQTRIWKKLSPTTPRRGENGGKS